jgi:hypothetical protein
MGDNGMHDVRTTHREIDRDRCAALVPTTIAGVACKYSKMAAASAVCLETKRTGAPPVLA